jgi:phosphotransferase system enzyme I (PtsI)
MIRGVASSPGVGVGKVYILHDREIPLGHSDAKSDSKRGEESEMERFFRGRKVAAKHYEGLIVRIRNLIGADEAEIFEGHLEIILGEDMEEAVEEALQAEDIVAEKAVMDFTRQTAKEFEELESEYFRQRAGDIRDIGRRMAEAIYYGSISDPGELPENSIIVAEELTPSVTARLDTDKVAAIATEKGGRTSHAAILARSLSIPCVTGAEGLLDKVHGGKRALVDGDAGIVDVDVSEEKLKDALERREAVLEQAERRRAWSNSTPSKWSDGSSYDLFANVGGAKEAAVAKDLGAGGVGLFRTEFLFMRFSDFPSVEQQAAEYRAVCEAMSPNPVIVRLLDCGADKPLPYAYHPTEDNPFLGERGIRFLAAREKRLKEQMAAISRVHSEGHAIKAMIPMVISAGEIDAVRSLVPAEAKNLPVGIMVETPAAVLTVEALAEKSDFLSVGTNDLIQYVLTVDRGNSRVADYYQEFHPAVLAALDQIVAGARKAGIHVGVCGDMASHPDTALTLLALGVNEISASVSAVPELKAAFSRISRAQLDELASILRSSRDADTARAAARALVSEAPAPWAKDAL